MRSRNGNRPLVYKIYAAQNVDRMEYGRVERVLSSKLRRAPPAAADRQGGRQPVVHSLTQFPLGGGGGRTHRPLLPAPGVILGRLRHLRACI